MIHDKLSFISEIISHHLASNFTWVKSVVGSVVCTGLTCLVEVNRSMIFSFLGV